MATTITDVLNTWNQLGVFSYVIPFLLIFAVVFAILRKTKLLSGQEDNKTIEAIIAAAIGLLALQFDFVSSFYSVIFPTFGVFLSMFLVLIILLGFFFTKNDGTSSDMPKWLGYLLGIGAVLYALSWYDFQYGFGGYGANIFVGWWISENFWALVILGLIVAAIYAMVRGPKTK